MDLEIKKKGRKVLRASFTRCCTELETVLAEPTEDQLQKAQVLQELLTGKLAELQVKDAEIFEAMLVCDVEEEDLIKEKDMCDTYLKRAKTLELCYLKLRKVDSPQLDALNESASSIAAITGKRKFKLPVIQFKKFDGNIKDWLSFWAQFKKIHEDIEMDPADKIEYLIQSTVPGSRARRVVESFPAIGVNYVQIVDSLRSRFGREDLQIEVYVRELLKLILNNALAKTKIELFNLYDSLETQLRSLQTLGITADKYAAILYPLIESCLPEELLRVWQRSTVGHLKENEEYEENSNSVPSGCNNSLESRLKALMTFLQSEVQNEQRISLAAEGFGLCSVGNRSNTPGGHVERRKKVSLEYPSTAADLLNNTTVLKCLFCEGGHESVNCFKATKLPLEKKKQIVNDKRACFSCLRKGHQARKCRGHVKCLVCERSHVTLMCPEIKSNRNTPTASEQPIEAQHSIHQEDLVATNCVSLGIASRVFMQTLRVEMAAPNGSCSVRALIDTGSQRSYVLQSTVQKLKLVELSRHKILHCLFGGRLVEQTHSRFEVELVYKGHRCKLEVLSQPTICNEVIPVPPGLWIDELHSLGIELADTAENSAIEVMIGADAAGYLITGRKHLLDCGLVAVETLLGWTLMGKLQNEYWKDHLATSTINLYLNDQVIANLWELDILGITEPSRDKSRRELEISAEIFFNETVKVDSEGRYEVRLPWLEGHPVLPSNLLVAQKRLTSTLRKLNSMDLYELYNGVLLEWEEAGIIERVPKGNVTTYSHYLPHRPVVRESSATTKIRPVFDAGARQGQCPSLNQCLEKGPNLIEIIPDVLIGFRKYRIGVISDIKKAFLQIAVNEADRDFLRFLWINSKEEEIIYRHRRVVFGVNCSPFLLAATIRHHLELTKEKIASSEWPYQMNTLDKLNGCFYVDNCVTSLPDEASVESFVKESFEIMLKGKFELTGWEKSCSKSPRMNKNQLDINVLGLTWNLNRDTLSLRNSLKEVDIPEDLTITRRLILSHTQRIFDPIGLVSPTTLCPKLLLQQTWKRGLNWDSEVNEEIANEFRVWVSELKYLHELEIPRWVNLRPDCQETYSLHVFCDASAKAYACVIFLRVEQTKEVSISLLASKARVAPLKAITIPRLELLGATIAARLYTTVQSNFDVKMRSYFWTDSTTVLSWIRRKEEWSTFVRNRVNEIRELTSVSSWNHVPGRLNSADLPSRGCYARKLYESKWWEGPSWLYEDEKNWPKSEPPCSDEEIFKERRKTVVALVNAHIDSIDEWHLNYFSKYIKTIRMIGWIFRFCHNARHPTSKQEGGITAKELNDAETFVLKTLQQSNLPLDDPRLKPLNIFVDDLGLIRLKTPIINRDDTEWFRLPIILPSRQPVVDKLIFDLHVRECHAGVQMLMSVLREKYWILSGRKYIRSVLAKCVTCKRHGGKPLNTLVPPLPLDRVRDAVAFEIVGVDFAGPLHLKNGDKVWVCLFTCAIFRAVHLELATSLSTPCFLRALRRFIARRGRPKTIYSDNGTNFVGANNLMQSLNWDEIVEKTAIDRIIWRFNPPAAPWWGGFWERMIGIMKSLLRRTLGRASLSYEELLTLLCDCEAIINSRPLTEMTGDKNELVTLTPAMYLREQAESGIPDCDQIDRVSLQRRVVRLQTLRDALRMRFRSEYLGQLRVIYNKHQLSRPVKIGEVVLIGSDGSKRLNWPLGRVTELLPGGDGRVRLVRLATSGGHVLRPIQRVFPLEVDATDEFENTPAEGAAQDTQDYCENSESVFAKSGSDVKSRVPETKTSRSGRLIKTPSRLLD